jgi:hypothetical protein
MNARVSFKGPSTAVIEELKCRALRLVMQRREETGEWHGSLDALRSSATSGRSRCGRGAAARHRSW